MTIAAETGTTIWPLSTTAAIDSIPRSMASITLHLQDAFNRCCTAVQPERERPSERQAEQDRRIHGYRAIREGSADDPAIVPAHTRHCDLRVMPTGALTAAWASGARSAFWMPVIAQRPSGSFSPEDGRYACESPDRARNSPPMFVEAGCGKDIIGACETSLTIDELLLCRARATGKNIKHCRRGTPVR
jgi:hypothetical protein